MELTTYTPPERTEGDSFKPSENVGHLLIVKVTNFKHIDSTIHKPEGGPAVIVDVCDLDANGAVFRDVLWMNGAIVDSLKGYMGKTMCITFVWTKSPKSGREYVAVEPVTGEALARAQAHVAKGDPFAVALSSVGGIGAIGAGAPTGGYGGQPSALPPF